MSIAAFVRSAGHSCDLLIENAEKNILSTIQSINPDLIAIPCTTGLHVWALDASKRIKNRFSFPILLGGHHPTFYPEVIEHPAVDMICIGEGEEATVELLDRMRDKQNVSDIANFWIKKDSKVLKNHPRSLISNLSSLPFANRSIYARYPFLIKHKNYRIITGRGCPFACTFCFNNALKDLYHNKGTYVRRRTPDHVLAELREAKHIYPIQRIDFQDDTFICNFDTWLRPFLRDYRALIGLPFTCCVRVDLVTEELANNLKKAGCYSVKLGIESGDDYLNNKILKKNLGQPQIINTFAILNKIGLKIEAFNMVGIPGETIETALSTLELNLRLRPSFARCSLLQPYPKTEIALLAKQEGLLPELLDPNTFQPSYFLDTPLLLKDKDTIINIQRLFNLCVRFPVLYPLVKRLIRLKPNWVFDLIFKIDYAFSVYQIDKMSLKDVLVLAFRSKGFFGKRNS